MEILILFTYVGLFLVSLLLSFVSVRYFITMWKFKNRKKDGSEDDQFRRFD